jgi:AcrR family transcriptional regulator
LLDQASRGLVAAAGQLLAEGDPRAMIRAFTETYIADLADHNGAAEFFMVVNQGFITNTPAGTAERLAATQGALWRSFASVLRRGQDAGQFAAGDPERMTAHYFALLSGLTTMRVALRGQSAEPDVDLILRLFTGGPR